MAEIERRISSINNREHKIPADKVAVIQLEAVLSLYDSLQEEPVSNSDWLTELQEKLDNATPEQLEELWNKYNGVDEEEPVSEDLEEASREWLIPQLDKSYAAYGETKQMELTHFDGYAMLDAIEFGAQWQKDQFEKNRLKHCNSITNEQAELEQGFIDQHLDKHQRMPTFLDAIEYGMNLQKEQMMAEAIDARCFGFQGAALFSFRLPADKYLVGSEVKVIVLKED